MKKLGTETVQVVKLLRNKSFWVNGKEVLGDEVIDKEGHWVQVEILDGPQKGTLKPVPLELLK